MVCAEYGATVIALDINEEAAKLTEKMIIDADGTAMAAKADITDRVQVHTVIADVIARFKKIDVLVNNAGSTRLGTMVDLEDSTYDFIINLNMKGPLSCLRRWPRYDSETFRTNYQYNVLLCGKRRIPNAPYCMAKAGIKMMTQVQALELGQYGISAVAIAPGDTNTELFARRIPQACRTGGKAPSKKYMQQQERRCHWDV